MAEQDTEDTRSPAPPRRAARPFIGPAGAAAPRSVPLRPPTPGVRPARGPFVPTVPTSGRPPAVVPSQPAVAPLQAGGVEARPSALAPAATAPEATVQPPETSVDTVPQLPSWPDAAVEPTAESSVAGQQDSSPYERFAAFDAAWQEEEAETPTSPIHTAPPLDVASLGRGSDGPPIWAEEIAAEPAASSDDASMPSWLMDDVEPVPAVEGPTGADVAEDAHGGSSVAGDGMWTDVTAIPSADAIMAAHAGSTELAADPPPALAAERDVAASTWPDQLLAEYAPYVPTPVVAAPAIPAPVHHDASMEPAAPPAPDVGSGATPADVEDVVPLAVAGMVSETAASSAAAATWDVIKPTPELETPGLRVSAALTRLAERVRDGEIDVSSIAPDAPDAAVLASVLAALLGGGSSSR